MKRVLTTPPGVYRHYKGDLYRVLLVGLMSTNGLPRRPTVCYFSLSMGGLPDFRDEEEFHDLVWRVDGKVFATGADLACGAASCLHGKAANSRHRASLRAAAHPRTS